MYFLGLCGTARGDARAMLCVTVPNVDGHRMLLSICCGMPLLSAGRSISLPSRLHNREKTRSLCGSKEPDELANDARTRMCVVSHGALWMC